MPRGKGRRAPSAKAADPQAGQRGRAQGREAPSLGGSRKASWSRTLPIAGICAVLILATLAAFWGLRSNDFIMLDDDAYITNNKDVQKGLNGESIAWAFTTFHAGNWHPVTWLSHMLDVQLFGMDAGKHHLSSLLLHCANAVLLLLLLFRMTGALWRSAFVASLFALHPLHVESVAWIAERKDVLSTFFWLLTLFAWLAYVQSKKTRPYALVLVLFSLGLMAKPMLVTLPFTLLLLDFWPLKRMPLPLREQWGTVIHLIGEKAPLFVLSAVSSVLTVIAQGKAGAVATIDQIPLAERLMNAGKTYAAYLAKMLWPSSLTVFYPHPRTDVLSWTAAAAFMVLVGITVLFFRLRRRAPYLLFGWLWYLGMLVPVIGLVQVGKQSMADRYTYVPLLGIFIAGAWGLAELGKGNGTLRRGTAAAVALAALLFVTRVQVGHWTDNETLFAHAVAVTPENDLAQFQIGNTYLLKGRLDEAIAHLEKAVRINPRVAESRNSFALALLRRGRAAEALEQLREAQRIEPGNAKAMSNLALTLLKSGMDLAGRNRFAEAAPLFEEASALLGDLPSECLMQWGIALLRLTRYAEAADRFRSLLARDPESGEAHFNLGFALSQIQRPAEAIPHYRKAYGRPGVRSESFIWIGDIYRKGELCDEAVQVYGIIPPGDPVYPNAAAGITACAGRY